MSVKFYIDNTLILPPATHVSSDFGDAGHPAAPAARRARAARPAITAYDDYTIENKRHSGPAALAPSSARRSRRRPSSPLSLSDSILNPKRPRSKTGAFSSSVCDRGLTPAEGELIALSVHTPACGLPQPRDAAFDRLPPPGSSRRAHPGDAIGSACPVASISTFMDLSLSGEFLAVSGTSRDIEIEDVGLGPGPGARKPRDIGDHFRQLFALAWSSARRAMRDSPSRTKPRRPGCPPAGSCPPNIFEPLHLHDRRRITGHRLRPRVHPAPWKSSMRSCRTGRV